MTYFLLYLSRIPNEDAWNVLFVDLEDTFIAEIRSIYLKIDTAIGERAVP